MQTGCFPMTERMELGDGCGWWLVRPVFHAFLVVPVSVDEKLYSCILSNVKSLIGHHLSSYYRFEGHLGHCSYALPLVP